MRARNINTMSRRRTRRPDGGTYRLMRKRTGVGRHGLPVWIIAAALAVGIAIWIWTR